MSAKLPSCRGPGGTPSLRPSSAVSIARIDTPSSDRGYATSCGAVGTHGGVGAGTDAAETHPHRGGSGGGSGQATS
eukprot:157776-Chlamydomonas_euryale.AAC.1